MSRQATPLISETIGLAVDTLRDFGQLRLRVTGASMLPALRPGDVLQFEACTAESAAPGDIVLFRHDGRLVVHRVLKMTATGLLTQGDSLADPDMPVDSADVLGRVVGVSRHGRSIAHHHHSHAGVGLARWLFRRSHLATRLFVRMQRRPIRTTA